MRIFVVGGSSAFGFGLNDQEAWPQLLHDELEKTNPGKYVVINAGNNGYNSLQTMLRYYLRVSEHDPSFLLFYEARNDISIRPVRADAIFLKENVLFSSTMTEYFAKEYAGSTPYTRLLIGQMARFSLGSWLLDKERTSPGFRTATDLAVSNFEEVLERNRGLYLRNLRTLVDMCRRDDVRLLPLTFLHDPGGMEKYNSMTIQAYNDALRKFAEEEGLSLVDLEQQFAKVSEKSGYFFKDGYHPNAQGAQFVAKSIQSAIGTIDRESSVH